MKRDKPIIGISIGDVNGIGPEVVIKALANKKILRQCTPVIYANSTIVAQYRKILHLDKFFTSKIDSIDQANNKNVSLLEPWDENYKIEPGTPTTKSGELAFLSIKQSVNDLKEGKIDALVTAPINKKNIQSNDFNFPGHTEYLFNAFNEPHGLMVLAGETLRVATVTGHVALKDVSEQLSKKKIMNMAKTFFKSLKKDFGVAKPKIAILGLNPHAGDDGLFGDEEERAIIPAINELKNSGHLAFGPFSPDGFFGSQEFQKFDGVLGMYHDQVLIPFKLREFDTGVNCTVGLNGIRTSPDHGTGFDIAGKNQADETSMLHAIFMAIDIYRSRQEELPED